MISTGTTKTIARLVRKFNRTGSVKNLPRRPKHRVTTLQQDRYIRLTHLHDKGRTASATARHTLEMHGGPISDQTVRNRLRDGGLHARRPYVGLGLSARHRQLRLAWTRRHLRFRCADWDRVLFTDESRFKLRRSDGRSPVYCRTGEHYSDVCVRERGQYGGGSVMVWEGISLDTKTQMVPIHQNLSAARYQNDILQPVAIPYITVNHGMVLMQDNSTPHTGRTTQQMLQGHNIRILDWPPCSPDLNPIEHFWDEIDRRVRQLPKPQNLVQLERDLVNTWTNLPQRFLFSYVNSMRRRCLTVIRANGAHT
jgi:hypothetical protein